MVHEWVFERGNSAIGLVLLILHAPLALPAAAQPLGCESDIFAYALSVPLNAYLWGFVAAGVVRLVRAFR